MSGYLSWKERALKAEAALMEGSIPPPPPQTRPCAELDDFFFTNGFAPLSVMYEHHGVFDSKTVLEAWKRTVRMTPLLQMEVIEVDNEKYEFQTAPEDKWPTMSIIHSTDDEKALRFAEAVHDELVDQIIDDDDAQALAGSAAYVLGPTRSVLILVNPHHFIDGMGYAALAGKFLTYCQTSTEDWPKIDALSKGVVPPTFREMLLKNHVSITDPPHVPLPIRVDPRNLSFVNSYSPFTPESLSQLHGMEGKLIHPTKKDMIAFRASCRAANATVTTILGALAVKVVVAIPADARNTYISTKTPGDLSFPPVANYAFITHAQFDITDVKSSSLESIAARLKANNERLLAGDPVTLRKEVLGQYGVGMLNCYVGVTSVNIPEEDVKRIGLDGVGVHSRIKYGPIPRCWFYAISYGENTTFITDIMLPIPDLDQGKALSAIKAAAKGTVLDSLLNRPSKRTSGAGSARRVSTLRTATLI